MSRHGTSIEPLMRCPFCKNDNDRVIDSRAGEDGFVIRRRRECLNCKRRYTTYERIEEFSIKVVKRDSDEREPFSRDKIRRGIAKACWKRPIKDEQIDALITDIEHDVYARFEREVQAEVLGEMVMQRLYDLDKVAYVRFASVYRRFEDVLDFFHELQPMLKQEGQPLAKNIKAEE